LRITGVKRSELRKVKRGLGVGDFQDIEKRKTRLRR